MKELPQFVEAHRRWGEKGLKVMLINVDNMEASSSLEQAADKVKEIQVERKIPLPIRVHPGPIDRLAALLGTDAASPPITAVFKDGKRLQTVSAAFEEGGLEKLLAELKVIEAGQRPAEGDGRP